MNAVLAALALALDRILGDPDAVWRRVPHPVAGFGALIAAAERRGNQAHWPARRRRAAGTVSILALLGLAALLGHGLHRLLAPLGWPGLGVEALVASVFLAQRSLADHVGRVAGALDREGLAAGRRAVSMIVGRDPEALDEAGVARAAIESLAENASDGVVAPWLFLLVFGLPGLLAYKMLNTADSMIGHLDDRYRDYGWAAARLDDVANLVPARLTAGLLVLAAVLTSGRGAGVRAARAAWADGRRHRSPNAGWPEAAAAGALALALGGPRRYGTLAVEAPLLHAAGRRVATAADIRAALRLFRRVCDLLLALTLVALAFTG
ncbi:cobalamin biosynthesis protein [Aureimonas flava]|uniref:Cobalamin biosynthesis protein CobD n=1 Tax=Aureimonas flava TaxID=2320271 RepID=A0A3A1WJM1_9HYPH|nr:adenosylcobinamide-phosphate synthase CbiB [Aureimonas flava]RIX99070.1 cobalamin biosynthesis protein [Aureimonas flava]